MPARWWVEVVLGPLVGKGMSWCMSRGGCGITASFGGLSADGWASVPAELLCLRRPSTGAYRLLCGFRVR